MKLDYAKLDTEKPNPSSSDLDSLTALQILRLMNEQDRRIALAVRRQLRSIARSVDWIVQALEAGGKLFFVGAGTSGRLGVLEAAELPPTFNTPPALAQAIMAGGRRAVFRSQEGAEDNAARARLEVARKIGRGDVVIGIAASGVTPFVQAALLEAKKIGARSILVTCNAQKPIGKPAGIVIALRVGPEIIAGSTRLKSATATKMVLNMLSTASMVRLGKVYGNRMVDLQPRSRKLRERALRLICEIARVPRKKAEKVFATSAGHAKTAIVMAQWNLSAADAKTLLKRHRGFLRPALVRKP